MADESMELPEVAVQGRNRFPGPVRRVSRAKETFSPGTFLPRVQALLNPGLYRERADTNNLVEGIFTEEGALGRLAATSPELVAEIRQQAESPMTRGEHKQFRAALLEMVGQEAAHESKVRATVADNAAFMEAFAAMDAALPGIKDPNRFTLEEAERRQIGIMFEQAQELALIDPDASRALMSEVRKKADGLTANARQYFEQLRKRAAAEDVALYSNTDNTIQLLRDAHQDLTRAIDSGKTVPEFVLQKALNAYGAAGSMQLTSLGQVGAHAVGEAIGGGLGGMTAGGLGGVAIGAAAGAAIGLGEGLVAHFKDKKNVRLLADALVSAQEQAAANYQSNRAKIMERYKPVGIEFGAQQGEVYAVVDEAYKAASSSIPESARQAGKEGEEQRETLRMMLEDQLTAANLAVSELEPEASANVPGAAQRLASAIERRQMAVDDLAIFEDDLRQQAGVDFASIEGLDPAAAEKAIKEARARRQNRQAAAMQAEIRRGIRESLRSHTR